MLLAAAPALADSVSNISLDDSADGVAITADYPAAQGFTTASNSAGYTLKSITLRLKGSNADSVKLHADSSGSPGAERATLSTTDRTTSGSYTNLTYICSAGCGLSDGESYHVVLTATRTGSTQWAQNSSGSETNTPSGTNWSIADNSKYRNGQGGSWVDESPTAVKLMTVSYVNPTLTAGNITDRRATLTIANHANAWRYKYTSPAGGICSDEVGAGKSTASVTGLTPGTTYTFKAYSDSACETEIATAANFTTLAVELWAENIRHGSAGLQLRNWTGGAWSYKVTGGSRTSRCTIVSTGSYAFAIQLDKGTTHTATAYSGRNCDTSKQLDTETFTTPASIQNYPALSASGITSTGATLSIANHTGDWWYKESADTSGTACKKVDAGTDSATLSGLSPNTFYRYYAYSHEGCDEATVRVTWITEKLDLVTSGAITATVTDTADTWATLAVSGLTEGQWSYQHKHYPYGGNVYPMFSDCKSHDYSTASVIVTGLKKGTAYEFLVHRGNSCDINERIVVKAHTFNFTAGQVGADTATLTMENYSGEWYHQQTGGSGGGQAGVAEAQATSASEACQGPVSGTTANVNGLSPGTRYTWQAYDAPGCAEGDAIATAEFTTLETTADTTLESGVEGKEASKIENKPPEFNQEAEDRTATEDQPFRYTAPKATDPDHPEKSLVYTAFVEESDGELAPLPGWLTFDSATRTFSGTPDHAPRTYTVLVKVTDPEGAEDTTTFTLTVEEIENKPPEFNQEAKDRTATEDQPFRYTAPKATDPDHPEKSLVYTAFVEESDGELAPLPGWLTFDSATRTFSGTPDHAPRTYTVLVKVTDPEGAEDTTTFTLTVEEKVNSRLSQVARQWLARFGRTVSSQVVDSVTGRLGNSDAGNAVVLNGQPLHLSAAVAQPRDTSDSVNGTNGGSNDGDDWVTDPRAAHGGGQRRRARRNGADAWVPDPRQRATDLQPGTHTAAARNDGDAWVTDPLARLLPGTREQLDAKPVFTSPTSRELLTGSSFRLSLSPEANSIGGAAADAAWTAWGEAAFTNFDAEDGDLSLDGEVFTGVAAVDWQRDQWLLGLALSHSQGDGSFSAPATDIDDAVKGTVKSSLTAAHPYMRYRPSPGLEVWGVAGYGRGTMTLEADEEDTANPDIWLTTIGIGGRGSLLTAEQTGGPALDLTADALLNRTGADNDGPLRDAVAASTTRLRLGLESSWNLQNADGTSVVPSLSTTLRYDAGDADTGLGVELGAAVTYSNPNRGLNLSAHFRGLLSKQDAEDGLALREWGGRGSIRYNHGGDDLGLTLAVAPSWGVASSRADQLWREVVPSFTATANNTANSTGHSATTNPRLDSEIGYGLAAFNGNGIVTPYAGLAVAHRSRDWRLGSRFSFSPALHISIEGTRREQQNQTPDHGIRLDLHTAW